MKKQRPLKRRLARNNLENALLGELLKKNPSVLHVLNRHGIHLCAGCYITLFSPLKKAAAYHAVPNLDKFVGDIKKIVLKRRS